MPSFSHSSIKAAAFNPGVVSLAGLVLLYALAGAGLAASAGRLGNFHIFHYSEAVGLATLLLLFLFVTSRIVWIMIARRPARLTAAIVEDMRSWLNTARLAAALPVLLIFLVFISVFTSLKMLIPVVHPFVWDETLMRLDRLLHFGRDPWRLTHVSFGAPQATTAINFIYNCWFFVMFGVLYWQLFSFADPVRRMQFFHAFILSWIVIGTMLATAFSSAGPCFYQGITGSGHFAPLIESLRADAASAPVWAIGTQAMLWRHYETSGIGLGTGISAMPSVHVATAFLFVLLAWRHGWAARTCAIAFFLCILVGSVHLGWHYAVDGYAAVPVVLIIWRLSGRWVRFLHKSSQES